jgi:hypothetical protein
MAQEIYVKLKRINEKKAEKLLANIQQ